MTRPPSAAEIVTMIGECMGYVAPVPKRRVLVDILPGATAETDKLREVYLRIQSQRARQALMDAIVSIADFQPD